MRTAIDQARPSAGRDVTTAFMMAVYYGVREVRPVVRSQSHAGQPVTERAERVFRDRRMRRPFTAGDVVVVVSDDVQHSLTTQQFLLLSGFVIVAGVQFQICHQIRL